MQGAIAESTNSRRFRRSFRFLLTPLTYIHVGNAGAVADDCKDAGGRATQEQLPTTARMQEVEQRRSSCREHGVFNVLN